MLIKGNDRQENSIRAFYGFPDLEALHHWAYNQVSRQPNSHVLTFRLSGKIVVVKKPLSITTTSGNSSTAMTYTYWPEDKKPQLESSLLPLNLNLLGRASILVKKHWKKNTKEVYIHLRPCPRFIKKLFIQYWE